MLDEILAKLDKMPADKLKQLEKLANQVVPDQIWYPHPQNQPQCQAYYSKADITLFGGSPGGGKTGLLLGTALTQHKRSLIVRKQFTDLEGVVDNLAGMIKSDKGIVRGNRPKYKSQEGRVIYFQGMGASGEVDTGKQGNAFDFIGVDEGAQLAENDVRLLIGWNRTTEEGQRCRIIIASNPPTSPVGDWLGTFFAPWFDPKHINPAKYGELRWFYFDDEGKSVETQHKEPFEIEGKKYYPHSRTYIFSAVENNPYIDAEEYKKNLQTLPEPFRTRLLSGNFLAAREDQDNQVIPTVWAMKCIERYEAAKGIPPHNIPMCGIGLDCTGGGNDNAVIAPRYDYFFTELVKFKTSKEKAGEEMAAKMLLTRKDQADIAIDMGGGFGGAVYEALTKALPNVKINRYVGGSKCERRSPDGKLQYFNLRSQAYWEFRLAADPNQYGGALLAFPNDPRLLAGLTAPVFEADFLARGIIKIETKEKVKEKLGYSPDEADAVVMAWWSGRKNVLAEAGLSYNYSTSSFNYMPSQTKMKDKYAMRRGL